MLIFRRKLLVCYMCEKLNNGWYAMRFWSCMGGARNRRWKALTLTRTSSEDIYARKSARNLWRAKKDALGNKKVKKEGENAPVCCST